MSEERQDAEAWLKEIEGHFEHYGLFNTTDNLVINYLFDLLSKMERLERQAEKDLHNLRCAAIEIDTTKEQCDTLRRFFGSVFRDQRDLANPDGGDLQDIAESMGLLVRVPADEKFRDDWDADEMYVWAWHPLAAEAREGEKSDFANIDAKIATNPISDGEPDHD